MIMVLLPLRYPMNDDTLSFGGMLTMDVIRHSVRFYNLHALPFAQFP